MTLKADGRRPGVRGIVRISVPVLAGQVEPGWAVLNETTAADFSGWTVVGPGEYSESELPAVDGADFVEQTFEQAERLIPGIVDLLDWGNGEFPLLMQAWTHQGVRRWMPWEDFSKYASR